MFRKLAFTLIIFSQPKTFYYKMIRIDDSQACVEAYTTPTIANRFNAKRGTCKEAGCTVVRGSKHILFVGEVFGYLC